MSCFLRFFRHTITEYDAATHVLIRENYAAMIENIDRWVGRYLDAVRQRLG